MKKYSKEDVRKIILQNMGKGSQSDMARVLGVSPQYLNDFLKYRRDPGPSILKALGLKKKVYYHE